MQSKPRKAPPLLPIPRSRSLALLLAHLYNRPDGAIESVSELAAILNVSISTLTRDVAELEQIGMLRSSKLGKAKIVALDEGWPYHEELESLFRKAFGPKPLLEQSLSEIPGISEAFIYGSWAARYLGLAGAPPEDIDLLVIANGRGTVDPDAIYEACRETSAPLGREVNPTIVTASEWQDTSQPGFLRRLHDRPLVRLELDQT